LGRLKQAITIDEYLFARDPVNAWALLSLGRFYFNAGQFDEAIARLRIALSLAPGSGAGHSTIGLALLLKGQPEAALVEMQQETSEVWRMIGLAVAYHALGRTTDAAAALAVLKTQYAKDWPYQIAEVHAYRGEVDGAFEWLNKAVEYGDPGISEIVTDSLFANLHADPRWLPFLRKINMAPEQLAAIKFDVKVPQ
jgi:tetratricopeptide (TPR) repeat protein